MGNYYDLSAGWFLFKAVMFVGGCFVASLIFWITGKYVLYGCQYSGAECCEDKKKGKKKR